MGGIYSNLGSGVGTCSVNLDPLWRGSADHMPVASLDAQSSIHSVSGYRKGAGPSTLAYVEISWESPAGGCHQQLGTVGVELGTIS